MDSRTAKLALARKKLKDHQEKKHNVVQKSDIPSTLVQMQPHTENISENNQNNEYHNYTIESESNNLVETLKLDQPLDLEQPKVDSMKLDVNVAEILISNKRNLEKEVSEIKQQKESAEMDLKHEINRHNESKLKISQLEGMLLNLNHTHEDTVKQLYQQRSMFEEVTAKSAALHDENNNLLDQLEFTKSILNSKEIENSSLNNQLNQLQSELDLLKVQMQQLVNGANTSDLQNNVPAHINQNEELLYKIDSLEQQLKRAQKEKDQINVHYEHYLGELNDQIKSMSLKNEELNQQVQLLSNRENSLVDQISEMEIRLQNLQIRKLETTPHEVIIPTETKDLQNELNTTQGQYQELLKEYEHLKKTNLENEYKIIELQEKAQSEYNHDNISMTKLTADIASDKIAAQRATEQNKKLKMGIQELEEAFVKMTQDKLELTEKITAEKFLNKELTIKLAEFEEKSKDMYIKLMAKDEEMIRLQTNFRDLEKQFNEIIENRKNMNGSVQSENVENREDVIQNTKDLDSADDGTECHTDQKFNDGQDCCGQAINMKIPKEDAMVKLQERFLKIMGDVADLSDEKHRLEHIILQLQNETDTICEYVALYQQQRCLLKKRDEERTAQVKLFQTECDRLKRQLEELSGILIRFAEDKELSSYFQIKSKQEDMDKVRNLLLNLKSNSLVHPMKSLDMNNVYPCNCCSGNLIEV